jgi:hypothetical protein
MDLQDYVKITRVESGALKIPRPEKFELKCPTCHNSINLEKKIKILLAAELEGVKNTLEYTKEKQEFLKDVQARKVDLISYFRRLREITAKWSSLYIIGWEKDAHFHFNERCQNCGLDMLISYNFHFIPPSIPSPKIEEIVALKLDDAFTQHYIRRELGFKDWSDVERWLSGEDTKPLIEELKQAANTLETLEFHKHPRGLNMLELSCKNTANGLRDLINNLEQEIQARPKTYLNLIESYSYTATPKTW